MTRRGLFLGCLVLLALPTAALAQDRDFAGRIVAALRSQGYDEIEVSRTWLGRGRIEAEGPAGSREIIFDPRTGEILRDLWLLDDDDRPGGDLLGRDDADDPAPSTPGQDDGDDDEGDDDGDSNESEGGGDGDDDD